jgi:hypothetical protein
MWYDMEITRFGMQTGFEFPVEMAKVQLCVFNTVNTENLKRRPFWREILER